MGNLLICPENIINVPQTKMQRNANQVSALLHPVRDMWKDSPEWIEPVNKIKVKCRTLKIIW
jgi:hypothetical protein